jgi:hypothetical protein
VSNTSFQLNEKRITTILKFFQYFYLFSAIVLLIVFLYAGSQGPIRLDVLFPVIIASIIAYGIYNRRSWVSLGVTLFASWGIISNIINPESPGASIFSIVILGLEIYFFNRKDVKAQLHTKGAKLSSL